jgi:hypothetical protein
MGRTEMQLSAIPDEFSIGGHSGHRKEFHINGVVTEGPKNVIGRSISIFIPFEQLHEYLSLLQDVELLRRENG